MCNNDTDANDSDGHECPTCDRSFGTRSGLGVHYSAKHGMSIREYESRQGEYECPSCDHAFDNRHGVAAHHVRVHGDSLAWKTVECEWCGDERDVRRSVLRKGTNIFCRGYECRDAYHSENFSGQDNPNWKGRVTVECHSCGKNLTREQGRMERQNRHFCSDACETEWRKRYYTNPNSGVDVDCHVCEKTITRKPSQVEQHERFFCSSDCMGSWMRCRTGENHPLFEGGRPNYGPGWNDSKKEAVRERDDRTCQHCGMSEEDHLEKFGRKHSVHHIQKARSFDDPEKRNAMSNLITLCHGDCHARFEQMAPLRPEVIAADD